MNDSFGADFNTTQTKEGVIPERKPEGIVPVLIKQLLNSPEGNFQMFDMIFGMVCVRAIVRNIETSSTKITYLLEDSTGRIEAYYWLEDGNALNAPNVMLNKYATIYGVVRSQAGQKALMVFKMFPVNDPNEVVTQILEVLYARYGAEEYASKGNDFVDYGAATNMPFDINATNDIGLNSKQLAVFQAIKNHNSTDGIDRHELKRKFSHMKESELNSILEFMISEGHIYSSIDADHFLSTE